MNVVGMKISLRKITVYTLLIVMMAGTISCSRQYRYKRMISKKRRVLKAKRYKNPYADRLKRRGTPVERDYYIKRRSKQHRRAWW